MKITDLTDFLTKPETDEVGIIGNDWRMNFMYDIMNYELLQKKARAFDRMIGLKKDVDELTFETYPKELIFVMKSSILNTFMLALNSEIIYDKITRVTMRDTDPDYDMIVKNLPKSSWIWDYINLIKEPEDIFEESNKV